jgi:hypothetical protein
MATKPLLRRPRRRDPQTSWILSPCFRRALSRARERQKSTSLKGFLRDNGLSLVLIALFVLFFAGQTVFGWLNYNDEKDAHYQPQIGFVQYLGLEPSARLSSKSPAVSEDSLLERLTAAPRRRHKSGADPGND